MKTASKNTATKSAKSTATAAEEPYFVKGELLGSVPLNITSDIKIHRATQGGVEGVDIRKYVDKPGYTGHTTKGVFIPAKDAAQVGAILCHHFTLEVAKSKAAPAAKKVAAKVPAKKAARK